MFRALFGLSSKPKTSTPPSQSSSASAPSNSNADFDKGDAKSDDVTMYQGTLGEAWPSSANLSAPLLKLTEGYLGGDIGGDYDYFQKRYTPERLADFTLWNKPIAITRKIGNHILAGESKLALSLIQRYPSTLECFALAHDPFQRPGYATPLRLAAMAGNKRLVNAIRELKAPDEKLLLSKDKAEEQLAAQFPPDWKEKQKETNERYIDAAIHFRNRLAENRLPNNLKWAEALIARKDIIDEFRLSLRPKPNDPARTIGLIVDPQIYPDVRQQFLDSEAILGGWASLESTLLWAVGFQSLLGASSAVIAHILIPGANKYSDETIPAEVLKFKDGTPFFPRDRSQGIGATLVLDFFGDTYVSAGLRWWGGAGRWDAHACFFGKLMSSNNINIAELMQLPATQLTTKQLTR